MVLDVQLLLKYSNGFEIKEMFVNYNLYVSEESVMIALSNL